MPLLIDSLGLVALSAYRKVRCIAQVFSGSLNIQKAIADILINGVSVGTIEVDMKNVGGGTYEAELNAATFVQDYLSPNSTRLPLGRHTSLSLGVNNSAPYQQFCSDLYCTVDFSVQYLYEDATTGKLVNLGITETLPGNPFDVYAAAAQHLDPPNAFADYAPVPSSGNKFLTNAPRAIEVCNSDAHYLSYFVQTGFGAFNRMRVRTFDSSGTLIDEGLVDNLARVTAGGGKGVFCSGVGVANLATQVYDQGSVTLPNPDVAYYLVDLGLSSLGSWISSSETYRFDIVDCCESYKVNLFFMNSLSGFDRIAFQYTEQQTNRSATTIQQPVPYPFNAIEPVHSPRFKGKYSVNIQSSTVYQLEKTVKSQDEIAQLNDLIGSAEVYAEINGADLQPVTILNATPTDDIKDDLATFQIVIQVANDRTTQRN